MTIGNNMLTDLDKFNDFIKRRNEFSSTTFGTPAQRSCLGPLYHLQEEVKELIENPNDEMEWADCFLLILDAAWRKGYTIDDLTKFANIKLEINKKRIWKKTENDVYKHV